MQPADFARELSAWIDPFVLKASADRIEQRDETADALNTILLASAHLQSGRDGNLDQLASLYLENFRVPDGLITLATRSGIHARATQWLRDLRFTGTIQIDPNVQTPPGLKAILTVTDRDALVDILMQPLQALMRTVEVFLPTWRRLGEIDGMSENAFLRHSSHGQFMVFIERQVAASCGYGGIATAGAVEDGANFGYRYHSMLVPSLPVDPRFVAAMRGFAAEAVV